MNEGHNKNKNNLLFDLDVTSPKTMFSHRLGVTVLRTTIVIGTLTRQVIEFLILLKRAFVDMKKIVLIHCLIKTF